MFAPVFGVEHEMGGYLGSVVEYISPVATLKEGSFESSAALEAGGDDMSDDDSMGAEQMLYEGLTGGEVDKVANPSLADSVDAGGQEAFVDVETMNSGGWESDDGTGVDVLVEPGQGESAPVGRVDRASSYRTNDTVEPPVFRPSQNGTNGAQRNGAQRNGAQRNGASANGAHKNSSSSNSNGSSSNGVVPRNRITAFDSAAPLIQGTGAATMARPRGFDTVAPPNPASFGLGQQQQTSVSPGFDLAKQITASAAQVGTAVALSRIPPQYMPATGIPGVDMTAFQQGGQQGEQPKPASVMPWVLGTIGVVGVGLGIWWLTRRKPEAPAPVSQAVPVEQPQVVRNYPRRPKATKKSKPKSKKSKRR